MIQVDVVTIWNRNVHALCTNCHGTGGMIDEARLDAGLLECSVCANTGLEPIPWGELFTGGIK